MQIINDILNIFGIIVLFHIGMYIIIAATIFAFLFYISIK